jgi:hypothetical protein
MRRRNALKPCFSMSHPSRVRTSPHRRLRPDAAWRFEYRGSEAISRGQSACLLICRSGNRARQAAEKLKSSGLPSLEVLTGGVLAWDAAGLPLNRGTKSMSLERQVPYRRRRTRFHWSRARLLRQPGLDRAAGLCGRRTRLCRYHRHLRHGNANRPDAVEQSSTLFRRLMLVYVAGARAAIRAASLDVRRKVICE